MAESTDPCVVLALGHPDRSAALAGSPQQGEGFWLGRQVGAAFSRGSALLLVLPPPRPCPHPCSPMPAWNPEAHFVPPGSLPFRPGLFVRPRKTGPQMALEPGFQGWGASLPPTPGSSPTATGVLGQGQEHRGRGAGPGPAPAEHP